MPCTSPVQPFEKQTLTCCSFVQLFQQKNTSSNTQTVNVSGSLYHFGPRARVKLPILFLKAAKNMQNAGVQWLPLLGCFPASDSITRTTNNRKTVRDMCWTKHRQIHLVTCFDGQICNYHHARGAPHQLPHLPTGEGSATCKRRHHRMHSGRL